MGAWFPDSLRIPNLQMIKSLAVLNEPSVIIYMQAPAVRVGRTLELDSEVSWENSELCSWLRYSRSWCFLTSKMKVQILHYCVFVLRLPWWLSGKEPACQCRRRGFNPWVGTSPWRGYGNPLQHSCLGNPMDSGAWGATIHWTARVRHHLATKQHHQNIYASAYFYFTCVHCKTEKAREAWT